MKGGISTEQFIAGLEALSARRGLKVTRPVLKIPAIQRNEKKCGVKGCQFPAVFRHSWCDFHDDKIRVQQKIEDSSSYENYQEERQSEARYLARQFPNVRIGGLPIRVEWALTPERECYCNWCCAKRRGEVNFAPKGERLSPASNVRRLVWSMLRDAVSCAFLQRGKEKARAEARKWIEAECEYPFSFVWCCDAVGASPSAFRGALTHIWRRTSKAGRLRGLMRQSRRRDASQDQPRSQLDFKRVSNFGRRTGHHVVSMATGRVDLTENGRRGARKYAELFVTKKSFYNPGEVFSRKMAEAYEHAISSGLVRELSSFSEAEKVALVKRLGAPIAPGQFWQ